ncbi:MULTISPECIES: TetR/AcrR family transcriptional regulator [Brevibacterium]|uniref:Transcriptional regulator, TetR family n=3 Tax=Brevibacterium TaxID=1696 RepID=A0A2H1KR87_9MICO|nr:MULTISPECIES: TetR/AcrR family transcriptional regulator [Brevibacterium]SMX87812.1 transcriptional regulator, TetR family [Brevibacterium antiquum]SMY02128.1 transcriptional regulator, TetR family [Brevibacterium antiquum CNRZ 918]HCG54780.1 TetR/AcrR family transcriptional regulator [Brevibacterium sp.]
MSRRDDIISAAIRLAEQSAPGQANLSVREVAKEAGIGASTLRHYFPTQSDLHEAIARDSMDTAVQDFSITDPSLDPADRLFECCAQFLPTHEHRDMQLELWLTMHISALGPERRAVTRRLLEYGHNFTYECLHRWLGILAEEGHIDPAEVASTSTALFTMLDGLALHSIVTPERVTVDAALDQLRWLIAKVLEPAPDPK